MASIPHPLLSLDTGPELVQAGLCLHGAKATESHCQRGLWSLHVYHYAGCFRIKGKTYRFAPGWVSLIPPEVDVEWYFPHHAPHYYAHFKAAPSRLAQAIPLLHDLGPGSVGFCTRMEEMTAFFPQSSRRANVRLWDLLFQLAEPVRATCSPGGLHPHLQIALSLIRNQPSEKILVASLARQIGVSHNHLTQIFQREYGCGVREYILRERVQRACELLVQTDLQVKSVAIECGFPDLQYFNKVIRRATGLAPSSYRSSHRLSTGGATAGVADTMPG